MTDGAAVPFTQTPFHDATSLRIELIPTRAYRPAYRVVLEGPPEFSSAIMAQDGNILALYPHLAQILKDGERKPLIRQGFGDRYRRCSSIAINSAGELVGWEDTDTTIQWEALVISPGFYRAEIQTQIEYFKKASGLEHPMLLTMENMDGTDCVQVQWDCINEEGITTSDKFLVKGAGLKRITLRAITPCEPVAVQCIRLLPDSLA